MCRNFHVVVLVLWQEGYSAPLLFNDSKHVPVLEIPGGQAYVITNLHYTGHLSKHTDDVIAKIVAQAGEGMREAIIGYTSSQLEITERRTAEVIAEGNAKRRR